MPAELKKYRAPEVPLVDVVSSTVLLAFSPTPMHRDSKWLKPAKNKFTWSHFTNISSKFQPIFMTSVSGLNALLHIQSLSNCCRIIVWSVNFTKFCKLIFGRILLLGPTVQRIATVVCSHYVVLLPCPSTYVVVNSIVYTNPYSIYQVRYTWRNLG